VECGKERHVCVTTTTIITTTSTATAAATTTTTVLASTLPCVRVRHRRNTSLVVVQRHSGLLVVGLDSQLGGAALDRVHPSPKRLYPNAYALHLPHTVRVAGGAGRPRTFEASNPSTRCT